MYPEAPPRAAAKRVKLGGSRPMSDEAERVEPLRIGPYIRTPVREIAARSDDVAGHETVRSDVQRTRDHSRQDWECRVQAERLQDRGIEDWFRPEHRVPVV